MFDCYTDDSYIHVIVVVERELLFTTQTHGPDFPAINTYTTVFAAFIFATDMTERMYHHDTTN